MLFFSEGLPLDLTGGKTEFKSGHFSPQTLLGERKRWEKRGWRGMQESNLRPSVS